MEPLWILIAFMLGFAANQAGLPPLVGYLAAGFVLNYMGVHAGQVIEEVADIGVLLLLFSIGLKLKLRSLAKPEVWAGASLHLLVTVGLFAGLLWGGLFLFSAHSSLTPPQILIIAFALSFSSTVFAVKILEERGEMAAIHGRIAIGILIMQDIFAVLFLTFSSGKFPSPWALAPLPVPVFVIRPLLKRNLGPSGHRELLLLFGLFLALGLGAGGFQMLGLKADLGALVLGILIAQHPKATELSEVLLSLKDLFLVGFFLNIGLAGLPTLETFGIASILVIAVAIKVFMYFFLLSRFRLRARTALMASFSLANYSEFGLLVALIGVSNGWISGNWVTIIAIALSISFVIASVLNSRVHTIYTRHCARLRRFETSARLPEDKPIDPGQAEILIFGMGRLGTGTYDSMRTRYGTQVLGLDYDPAVVTAHQESGRDVILDDATDSDFWEKIRPGKIRLVMLAMSSHEANLYTIQRLSDIQFQGTVTAIARYDDHRKELEAAGVSLVFNFFSDAGAGFADFVCERLDRCALFSGRVQK